MKVPLADICPVKSVVVEAGILAFGPGSVVACGAGSAMAFPTAEAYNAIFRMFASGKIIFFVLVFALLVNQNMDKVLG